MIINQEEIVRVLKSIRKYVKETGVIVDSSNIITKRLTVPKTSKKNLINGIGSEFDMEKDDELYTYDYSLLRKNKENNTILACAVQREFLEKYIATFKMAKIKIQFIDSAINSIVRHAKRPCFSGEQSVVLNIVFGNSILSILFEKGVFRLANRNRMLNEPGTDEYITELFAKFSTMVQFSKSQKLEYEIAKSYYVGLDEETLESYITYARETDATVTVAGYEDGHKEMEYFYPILGFERKSDDINLAISKKAKEVNTQNHAGVVLKLLVLVLILVVMGRYYYSLYESNQELEDKIESIESYISEKETDGTLSELDALLGNNEEVLSAIDQYKLVFYEIEYNQMMSPELLTHIYEKDGITSLTYSVASRELLISGTFKTGEEATSFSEALREGAYADNQFFQGYSAVSYDTNSSQAFSILFTWDGVDELMLEEIEQSEEATETEGAEDEN